jgi:hypothetical protein
LVASDALNLSAMLPSTSILVPVSDADLLCDNFFARMERGGGLPSPAKLPYFPDEALELTRRYERSSLPAHGGLSPSLVIRACQAI